MGHVIALQPAKLSSGLKNTKSKVPAPIYQPPWQEIEWRESHVNMCMSRKVCVHQNCLSAFHTHRHAWMNAQATHILYHLLHHRVSRGSCAHTQTLKSGCDFTGCAFQPSNSVCLQLFTTTLWFRHAWPRTHEQPPDEKLWQLSSSGHRHSQWELTVGNVIATLSCSANAAFCIRRMDSLSAVAAIQTG